MIASACSLFRIMLLYLFIKYLGIKRKSRYRNVFRSTMNIKVFAPCIYFNIPRMIYKEWRLTLTYHNYQVAPPCNAVTNDFPK